MVIERVAFGLNWAWHRRRNAIATCRPQLALLNFLSGITVLDTAHDHDKRRSASFAPHCKPARSCSSIRVTTNPTTRAGAQRGRCFATRTKDNLVCRVKRRVPQSVDPSVLKDELIVLRSHYTPRVDPEVL